MINRKINWFLGGLLNPLLLAALARAADAGYAGIDKSQYHILNPTPAQYLRVMDTDGPGATESPYTVDAGHFQIELTFLAYASEEHRFEGEEYELDAWAIAPMILKVGLLNQLDAQLVLQPYQVVEERIGSQHMTSRGFGDMTLRLKYNFWGNDGGRTAFAATPYVKFPTSAEGLGNNSIEGGLVLPLSIDLPDDVWLGLTTRFDAMRDWPDDGYHAEFMNSISAGAPVFAKAFGYMEFFSLVSTERDVKWVGTLNTGFIYSLSANIQLNTVVNLGVTRSADDWTAFAGMAWRY
jgi:outer membrane putative beta-barrel porin/alpha-amylase